jgi:hypothetical protein
MHFIQVSLLLMGSRERAPFSEFLIVIFLSKCLFTELNMQTIEKDKTKR